MKIAILVRVLWPGGVQRTAIAEAEGLISRGHQVELIFIRDTGRFRYNINLPIKILYGPEISSRPFGKIFRFITNLYSPERGSDATVDIDLIWKAERFVSKRFDIIYYFDEFSALFSKKLARNNKNIILIHEVYLNEGPKLHRFVQKKVLKNGNLILTNTKYNLQKLTEAGYKHSYELFPGLLPRDSTIHFDMRKNIALSVTMWDSGRRPENLLEVAKNLKTGKILLCGDWTDYNYMQVTRKKIIEMKLSDKIEITGPITEDKLISYYKEAKVAIRFGYNERGPGMGSLEAISWGIPLVINGQIGAREIIEENQCGYIINENEPDTVASILEDLFVNKEKWTELSQKTIVASLEYTWNSHNNKLNDLINRIGEIP